MIPAIVIVIYLVSATLVGSTLARRNRSSADWAIADSRMGMWIVAFGIAGTRIGGVGTYGVAGDVMATGLWNLWYAVNTFLALALVGLFFAVPFRRLRVQTVAEVFTERFGRRRCQAITSLCVQTEYLIVNILEPFVIGSIASTILDIPFGVGVLLGGICLIVYTSLGGLWGSAITNVIHCFVVVIGLALVGFFGLRAAGGWHEVQISVDAALATTGTDPGTWWSFTGAGWAVVFAMFFSATIHTPAASVYVNFASAARKERELLPAFLLGGGIAALMPLLAGFIGILTLARYGAEANLASYRSITQLALDINPILGGIALAAILAAVVSSGGPILLAGATMFVRDWMPRYRDAPPEVQLRAYRTTTIVYGAVAAFIAWVGQIRSILDLLLLGFAMVVPPAIALGFLFYWKRTTERACYWSIAIGYGCGLLWYAALHFAPRLLAPVSPGSRLGAFAKSLFVDSGGIDPSYVTTLVPLVLVPLISLLGPPEGDGSRADAFHERLGTARSRQLAT